MAEVGIITQAIMTYTLRCRRDMKRLHDKQALRHFAFCYAKAIEIARREERMGTEETIKGFSEDEKLLIIEALTELCQTLRPLSDKDRREKCMWSLEEVIALRRKLFADVIQA